MLGLKFYKGLPTDYVIKYVRGKVVVEGLGLAFSYFRHNTQIVAVSTSNKDGDVFFNGSTSDFCIVSVRAHFTYRIVEPHKAAAQFNFSVDTSRRRSSYTSRESSKLQQQLSNIVQLEAQSQIAKHDLAAVIYKTPEIAQITEDYVASSEQIKALGVQILNVVFLSVKHREGTTPANPDEIVTPQIAKVPTTIAPPKTATPRTYGRRANDGPLTGRRAADKQNAAQSSTRSTETTSAETPVIADNSEEQIIKRDGTTYLFIDSEAAKAAKLRAESNRKTAIPTDSNNGKSASPKPEDEAS